LYNKDMNPSSSESGGMNLPPPMTGGEGSPSPVTAESAPAVPEQAARPEQQTGAPLAQPLNSSAEQGMALPLPSSAPSFNTPGGVASTTDSTDAMSKDEAASNEKIWVEKAKQVVERTREDPYRQSEELTVVKAEYLKQRYNKTIKTSQ
jgi:hypothetical protein